MKLLERSLVLSALVVPSVLNAAMLRFDVTATDSTFAGEIGVLSGSHLIIDTDTANSSTDPTNTLFSNSIVGGHLDTMHPINGPVSADITDANSGSITATNDGINTTWTIPIQGENPSDTATMTIEFGGVDLYSELSDDEAFYNDNYRGGTVESPGLTIDFDEFAVTDVTSASTPDPVPLPPTVYLMLSGLGMMLWRSNLSVSQLKQLLTS
jgi:hypothetical protein